MTPHARTFRSDIRTAAAIVLVGVAASMFVLWRLDSILGTAFSMLASTVFSFL